ADLQQTLKLIYDLTGVNIVLSSAIKGKVTINVKDLPLRQVLDLIVEANNLKYVEKGKVIRIMSRKEYEKSEEGLAKINKMAFPLQYAEAVAIAKIIRETLKIEAVTADPRTNSIVVDVANTSEADKVKNLIQGLDAPVSQVLIDVKLIEVVLSEENSLGIDWEMASQVISEIEPTTTLTGPIFGEVPSALVPASGVFGFAISNKRINSIITALAKQGDTHALSQPRILTLDGKQATIDIIEEVPYVSGVTVTSTTAEGVTTYAYSYTIEIRKDIGIVLSVTPRIQRNRSVNLHLDLSEIRIIDYLELPISSTAEAIGVRSKTPWTADRVTSQDVVVWDGQTLILGGMISTRKSKTVNKIPFLGSIPLLGHLFKKTSYEETKSELVIFLTPYVITSFEEGRRWTKELGETPAIKEKSAGIIEKF
ncbi:MAG: secretin and TonB N-terminal domain-containing protein, partial [Candidatus Omnitrophica bacterium]|nr:secretin and TonB N-terminal domain-containing protein [Candidatus Omnitrophota bacterium]